MPDSNVFTRISNSYYQLTSSEKKVADYVVVQQQKVQYLSISELAVACGVADATISRFCRQIGYRGYNAFKLAIAKATVVRHGTPGLLSGEVMPEDSIPDMCHKLYTAAVETLAQTRELIQPEAIRKAADVLLAANTVLCMGQGGTMIMAEEAANLFSTAFRGFFPVRDSHMQGMAATHLTDKDAVLYFSYSGATRDLIELLPVARQRGTTFILVTRFPNSPGAAGADIVLQCGSNENPLQLGSAAARISQIYLLDILMSEMCRRDMECCKIHRQEIADVLSEKHI
ncbi:MurR/RpiR family transcriptional regulator [Pygmaiobacter massiliensis]|uniref:MurR/RpiR family transcriptional regulator n=1 Tax=Pygmaiobacter massiliensis TaxID=1917873 RepID=UPI000C799C03|nr:MurR/RpiR family transcriptional regulator [Pygmaiobacter massiliensis]